MWRAPKHCAGFLRDLKIFADSRELKNQIVVEMVGLAALARDAVNVEADKPRLRIISELSAGLFDDFTASGIADFCIFRVNMAAWEQPAAEAAMMHQEYPLWVRRINKASGSDMAGSVLMARERSGRAKEQ